MVVNPGVSVDSRNSEKICLFLSLRIIQEMPEYDRAEWA